MTQNQQLINELRELTQSTTELISKMRIMQSALEYIARGHHDPTPTRALLHPDTEAGRVDMWWQNYYMSNDTQNKRIARVALDDINE